MCYNCWEDAGSPQTDTPAIRKAAELIGQVYEFNYVGGNLHIVIDDWNIEDAYLESCPEWIRADEEAEPEQKDAEMACYEALKQLTEEERYSALALYDGFWGR